MHLTVLLAGRGVLALAGRRLTRSPGHTAVAGATGALLGVAIGLPLGEGAFATALIAASGGLIVAAIVPRMIAAEDRPMVARTAVAAFALRAAVAAVLYTASTAAGRGGEITGDDRAYADLAWAFVRYLKGDPQPPDVPPEWNGQAYLFGTFVYVESALFYVVGRQMLAMEMLNALAAALTGLVLFDLSRRLFGAGAARAALALMAIYPSLVLWSSLNLKDALVILLSTLVLWTVQQLQLHPRWWLVALVFALLLPIQSMRSYSFVGLVLIVPIALGVAAGLRSLRTRTLWVGTSALVSLALLAPFGYLPVFTDPLLSLRGFEIVRESSAAGARTAFVGPPAVRVREGDTLYVVPSGGASATTETPATASPARLATQSASPAPLSPSASGVSTAAPTESQSAPTLYYVKPGTRVVLITPTPAPVTAASTTPSPVPPAAATTAQPGSPRPSATASATQPERPVAPTPTATGTLAPTAAPANATNTGSPAVGGVTVTAVVVVEGPLVRVRPGDIVVVGTPGTTPAPRSDAIALNIPDQTGQPSTTVAISYQQEPRYLVLSRALSHLPVGIAHALFAPFPWQIGRLADVATFPEMLIWYLLLAGASWSVWLNRSDWRRLAPMILYIVGILGLFSLVEGNVGTLFRHRATILPYVIVLAAPALRVLAPWVARRARRASLG